MTTPGAEEAALLNGQPPVGVVIPTEGFMVPQKPSWLKLRNAVVFSGVCISYIGVAMMTYGMIHQNCPSGQNPEAGQDTSANSNALVLGGFIAAVGASISLAAAVGTENSWQEVVQANRRARGTFAAVEVARNI